MSGEVGRRGSRRRLSFCSLAFLHREVLALYIFAFESHVRIPWTSLDCCFGRGSVVRWLKGKRQSGLGSKSKAD